MAIIDELGRGTSTRDGLAIALSIAEALVESKAMVWFATHFRDLGKMTKGFSARSYADLSSPDHGSSCGCYQHASRY
jgi:DNA mismatch repair ATPase MutS